MPWAVVVSDDAGCGLGGKPELCTRSISRQTGSDPTFEASTALKILRPATKPQPATAAQAQEFDLSLVFRLVREWYVRDGLEDDLAVGVDRGWEGLGRAVDRDGRGAQGA